MAPPPGLPSVFAYSHDEGVSRSITSGYVARGPDRGLFGRYLFGDFVLGRIWTLADRDRDGDLDRVAVDHDSTFGAFNLTSFGEDGDGTLYAVGIDGTPVRVAAGPVTGRLDCDDRIGPRAGYNSVFAGAGDDRVIGGGGDDYLAGMEGGDVRFSGRGKDQIVGGRAGDSLRGSDGRNLLLGGFGNDDLRGQGAGDLLIGGAGADQLAGR